jgi:ribosomal protein S18 acetylase RimI-like enzyme
MCGFEHGVGLTHAGRRAEKNLEPAAPAPRLVGLHARQQTIRVGAILTHHRFQCSGQRNGWIDYIGTRPDHLGQGLGRAVLLASLDQLHAWGAHTARLLTISTNMPAIALYRSTGFARAEVPEPPSYQKSIDVA